MKIKRFVAPDMRTAFQRVRQEQGPNAVILSNRRIEGGVEVVAATDYDEALVQQAMQRATPAPAATSKSASASVRPVASAAKVDARALWAEDPNLKQVRRELAAMRAVIEREVGRFTDERLRGAPSRASVLHLLEASGMAPELCRLAAASVPHDVEPARARGIALGVIAKSLTVPEEEPLAEGGVISLVGPTGVGKTTTLAKLAARYATLHSARDVALVSADTYRIGAREQLQHFGRLLGMPVFEVEGPAALDQILDRLNDYRLVLIDTAGIAQRDRALMTQLRWLRDARRIRNYLVLPANAGRVDLEQVVARFNQATPHGAIVTKLDETTQLGALLSVAVQQRLPLVYATDGQRVPEDLHRVEAHRLVLRLCELERAHAAPLESAHDVA